jgi:hypothetical protein
MFSANRPRTADRAGHTRQHVARIGELEEQPVNAEHHQDQSHAGVGDHREKAALPVGLDGDGLRARGGEGALAGSGRHLAAVELRQQLRHVARGQIDHLLRERLVSREAHRFAHRALSPFHVAAAQLREAADVRRRVVRLFLGQRVLRSMRFLAGLGFVLVFVLIGSRWL